MLTFEELSAVVSDPEASWDDLSNFRKLFKIADRCMSAGETEFADEIARRSLAMLPSQDHSRWHAHRVWPCCHLAERGEAGPALTALQFNPSRNLLAWVILAETLASLGHEAKIRAAVDRVISRGLRLVILYPGL